MSDKNFKRADKIEISVSEDTFPEGWEKTHEEYKKPIKDGLGYYIYTYESEHFLISRDVDKRNGETVHDVSLLKVKRDDDGERLTAIGTGVYHIVGIEKGRRAYKGKYEESDWEDNEKAHKEAEKSAFQLAFKIMQDVNAGKYSHKRYDSE